MSEKELKEQLIEDVIDHVKLDMLHGDYTSIDELLGFIPNKNLIGFLPEEDWGKYKSLNQKQRR